jgi:SAM-dependent methyltransferase
MTGQRVFYVMTGDKPNGVLESTYSLERRRKKHLRFRLQTRALLVHRCYLKFGNGNPAPAVVDFGAAEGLTLLELARLFGYRGDYLGVEYSRRLIELAPPFPSNVKLLHGDITELPKEIGEESKELVAATAVFEHLPDPIPAIRGAFRILKPGGLLVATCPDPRWDLIATKLGLLKEAHHQSSLDRKKLTNLVMAGGFELLRYQKFMLSATSFLPYLGIPIRPQWALSFDTFAKRFPFSQAMFVNQSVVGRKP